MGSVSSLVNNNSSLNSKHCRASDFRIKKGTSHQRKSGGCSLDGLLRCGFTQGSSSTTHPSKGLSHSRSGRSEDFFYIKVSHKPRSVHHRGGPMEDNAGGKKRDGESQGRPQPKLLLMSGNKTDRTSAEKALVRSTAFKPVVPRSVSSSETGPGSLCPLERARSPGRHKQDTSGTLSDSGRNSMSSLPSHSEGSSAPVSGLSTGGRPGGPPRLSGNSGSFRAGLDSGGLASAADSGSPLPVNEPRPLSESAGGIRSPISTDETLIEHLEQKLLERECELQALQVSFEEKEADTCELFEERQRHCTEEMEGLKLRCSTKLRQVSQTAAKTQQALQLQVSELQAEKQRLQEEVASLTQEKDLAELRLRSYEAKSTPLAPTLEETQWEVCQKTGEISLLKQQLRDCQADVSHKLSEIVSLRSSLKENTAKMEVLEKQNKDHEGKLHSRAIEVEVCHNELQRKKNEASLLREKVGRLETDIEGMKEDLAKEKRLQQSSQPEAQSEPEAPGRETQGSNSPLQEEQEENSGHKSTESLQREVDTLKRQLREEKDTKQRQASSFEQERKTWNKEKEKVIKYQKQLQINYLHMHRKNQDLERILRELTAELEGRPELGMDANYSSGLQTYDDVIATEI